MWFIAGHNRKVRNVAGGRKLLAGCPKCKKRTTFREVEIAHKYHVFFVSLYDDVVTGVRCDDCGDVFTERDAHSILDTAEPLSDKERAKEDAARVAAEAHRAKAEKESLASAQAKARLLAAEREKAKRERESEIDSELHALKRRLGK